MKISDYFLFPLINSCIYFLMLFSLFASFLFFFYMCVFVAVVVVVIVVVFFIYIGRLYTSGREGLYSLLSFLHSFAIILKVVDRNSAKSDIGYIRSKRGTVQP